MKQCSSKKTSQKLHARSWIPLPKGIQETHLPPQNALIIALGFPLELDGKSLLLTALHSDHRTDRAEHFLPGG